MPGETDSMRERREFLQLGSRASFLGTELLEYLALGNKISHKVVTNATNVSNVSNSAADNIYSSSSTNTEPPKDIANLGNSISFSSQISTVTDPNSTRPTSPQSPSSISRSESTSPKPEVDLIGKMRQEIQMQLIKEVMVGAALQLLDADIIEPVVVSKESKKRGDFRHVFDETKAYWSGLGTF